MSWESVYFCIDMKTFYASVECAERGLDPFETDLVVADLTRGKNALCLAVTPKMKARGVHNRCRISEIPKDIRYEAAPPRMQLYIDYAADIYSIYLDYFDPRDIHVYSIDECFIDAGKYLEVYRMTPRQLTKRLMDEIYARLHIPSTAGIGTNLYLTKIALDITAKHSSDRMGVLDEETYCETLWEHEPITDFWQISKGTAARLEHNGMRNMRDVAAAEPELLYKLFGVNAELLIDHAWGRESCLMEDIKSYKSKSRSVSFSQILPRDYSSDEARTVLSEMVLHGAHELMRRRVIAKKVGIYIGYSHDARPVSKGSAKLERAGNLNSQLLGPTLELYDRLVEKEVPVRRLAIGFEEVVGEERESIDLFSDTAAFDRERARERAVLSISARYGKNAVLRGMNFLPEATQRERNEMIGGHRAGYDEAGKSKAIHGF